MDIGLVLENYKKISDFFLKVSDKLCYVDIDCQGYINNVVFVIFLEIGCVEVIYGEVFVVEGVFFVIVWLELDFLVEVNWLGEV